MSRIFISYQSNDQALAFEICEYLESRGLQCWIAPRDIHAGEYAGEITRALKNAGFLVLVCSSSTASSSHVKNEVALSFNNGSRIIPFFRETTKLDDSLEYFLAGKQRVYLASDKEKSLANLYAVITGKPVELAPITPGKASRLTWRFVVMALVLAAIAGASWYYLAVKHGTSVSNPVAAVDSTFVIESIPPAENDARQPEIIPAEPKEERAASTLAKPSTLTPATNQNADTFTGKISGGYPDGIGTYTFKQARQIDMHDEQARRAEPGDYITGEWDNGHLIQGTWYSSDGVKKGFLSFGKGGDPGRDHVFEKCAR